MSDSDTMSLGTDEQRVLAEVSGMVVAVLGDRAGDPEIGMDTQFTADLDMVSLDLVELSVQLRDHYGERVNFAEFIAGVVLDELIELSVGQLVRYIVRVLADPEGS